MKFGIFYSSNPGSFFFTEGRCTRGVPKVTEICLWLHWYYEDELGCNLYARCLKISSFILFGWYVEFHNWKKIPAPSKSEQLIKNNGCFLDANSMPMKRDIYYPRRTCHLIWDLVQLLNTWNQKTIQCLEIKWK